MDIFEVIQKRRTIRKFTGASLPVDDLRRIVDCARLAASGMNCQPWEFIAITDPAGICRLCIPPDHWMASAGAVIAVVADPSSRWWIEDAAAAVQNMLLASTALGYGAAWIEGYTLRNEELFKSMLGIPGDRKLFTLVAVGVPAEQPDKEKKPLDAVLHWQRYEARA